MQSVIVYIIIGIALTGLGRFIYRKVRALRKDRTAPSACSDCPLKENCMKKECPRPRGPSIPDSGGECP